MIHYLLKLFLCAALGVGALLILVHAFPAVLVILAIIGVVRLYEAFRGPKPPPPGPGR
jgi:hypothetical protein